MEIRDKHREIGDGGEREGKGRGRRDIFPEDKGLPLNREETDVACMAVYKGKREKYVLG